MDNVMKPLEAITELKAELDALKAEARLLWEGAIQLETVNAWLERERDQALVSLAICQEANAELREQLRRLEAMTVAPLADGGS